jgi:hypothetical protein
MRRCSSRRPEIITCTYTSSAEAWATVTIRMTARLPGGTRMIFHWPPAADRTKVSE